MGRGLWHLLKLVSSHGGVWQMKDLVLEEDLSAEEQRGKQLDRKTWPREEGRKAAEKMERRVWSLNNQEEK